jgi:hypothetical protein
MGQTALCAAASLFELSHPLLLFLLVCRGYNPRQLLALHRALGTPEVRLNADITQTYESSTATPPPAAAAVAAAAAPAVLLVVKERPSSVAAAVLPVYVAQQYRHVPLAATLPNMLRLSMPLTVSAWVR